MLYHFAATLIRGDFVKPFFFTIEHTYTGRTVYLMSGKNIKIRIQILYVYRHVRNGLGTVYKYWYSLFVGKLNHLLYRIYCTQHIGDMGYADNLRTFRKQSLIFVYQKFAPVVHRNNLNGNTSFGSQQLPGNDITVMFHNGEDHFVTFLHKLFTKTGYKQIDTLRRSTGEDNFVRTGGIDKLPHCFTGSFMQFRSLLRKKMYTTMHVGVDRIIFICNGIYYTTGFLGSGPIIQINQRLAIYLTGKYREISSYLLKIIHILYILFNASTSYLQIVHPWHLLSSPRKRFSTNRCKRSFKASKRIVSITSLTKANINSKRASRAEIPRCCI